MNWKPLLISASVVACAGCTGTTYVSAPGRPAVVSPAATVTATLTPMQAASVHAYVQRVSETGAGRGRGRNGTLPPGIARNLERGKPLPPGIAKQYLPRDLAATLPSLQNGLEYVIVAGKLLVVEVATQIVRDVLIDVLFD
jgi:hypothetical protein